ncbi:winged helix-turn-helix transcriptional regulator [Aureibacillus halotolerans]|uniref:HxlR family transcriptional regulator n=1 Tax=Aureibacillus halotolerans TaxID=1508390 RepID=A0A4R6TYI2_9BACI|nr:helix-turn-helix domain-containing protein [Aureibacillus halotolerans]TDQ38386.1 HxlR family transcriptional regulator [Aureibacillus halotolerans]
MHSKRKRDFICTSEVTLGLISGKWKPLILGYLSEQTYRFNELEKLMPDITQKMLTMQLKAMETDGLVKREVYAVVPPKVEYSLTDVGQRLAQLLNQLCEFGEDYMTSTLGSSDA